MKLNVFFSLVFIMSACSSGKFKDGSVPSLKIEKETINFEIGFNPVKAFLNDNHLILFGQDSMGEYQMLAVALYENQIDSLFLSRIYSVDITDVVIKNDTVLSYFEGEQTWKYWNGEWNDYALNRDWFYVGDHYGLVKYLYEDSEYVVFGVDIGEFGGAVNFYNKRTEELFVAELYGVNGCLKVEGKYIVNGNLQHGAGSVNVVEIDDPEKLHLFPDSLNFYQNDISIDYSKSKEYFDFLQECNHSVLPDTLVEKWKDFSNLDYCIFDLSREIINKELHISTIIDSSFLLCYATFQIDNQLVHLLNDTALSLGVIHNDSLCKVEPLYNESFYACDFSIQNFNELILMSFFNWRNKDEKEKMVCLIWSNNHLKRFNFN